MLSRLLEQKRAVCLYISENNVNFDNLLSYEWKLLEECISLLKPFEEVTKIISSACSSISEVIPHVKTLLKYLQTYGVSEYAEIMQMKIELESSLKRRFIDLKKKAFALATLLDPRYKLQFFDAETVATVKSQFLLEALKNSCDDNSGSESEAKDTNDVGRNICYKEANLENSVHRNFWDCYNDIVSKKVANTDSKSPVAMELRTYCALSVIKRNDDPFSWWKNNNQRFPKMAVMAKKYLCCPASTVYSERLFSEAGNVYETKRSRLLPDRAEHLTFLHHNLPFLNKEM